MEKYFLKSGAIIGGTAVIIGAFGAHYFKHYLTNLGFLETYETAVKYQFYGAFSLLLVGILANFYPNKFNIWAGILFLVGTLIFSGSLYVICITKIKIFGAITPIGGFCLILAWVLLFLSFNFKNK